MDFALAPENEHLWAALKRDDREGYFDAVARAHLVAAGRPPGSRLYRTQFGVPLYTPPGLSEAQAHKAAKHMAVAQLTPAQDLDYRTGRLQVYVIDELGRKHWLLFGDTGKLGLRKKD